MAATLLELAAGIAWVRAEVRPVVNDALGLPADHFVRTIVVVGHASEAAKRPKSAPGKARLPASETVFAERWPSELSGHPDIAPRQGGSCILPSMRLQPNPPRLITVGIALILGAIGLVYAWPIDGLVPHPRSGGERARVRRSDDGPRARLPLPLRLPEPARGRLAPAGDLSDEPNELRSHRPDHHRRADPHRRRTARDVWHRAP